MGQPFKCRNSCINLTFPALVQSSLRVLFALHLFLPLKRSLLDLLSLFVYGGHLVPLVIFRALTALFVVRIMISGMAISSLLYRRTTVYNFCLRVCVGSKTDADCGTFGRYHDRFRRGTFIRGKSTIFAIFLNGIT